MSQFLSGQLGIFLMCIAGGIIISLLYDIFRALRKSIKTADIVTYIEDIIFWILVGGFLIYLIFILNDGNIRFFIFVGLILGGILYHFTLSKFFMKITVKIFTFLKKILLAPIRLIFKLNKKIGYFICINVQNMTKFLKSSLRLQKTRKKLAMKKEFRRFCRIIIIEILYYYLE